MITSSSNSQLKNLIKLLQKSKVRKENKLFVVEGRKMFFETPDEMLDKIYISQQFEQKVISKDLLCQRNEEDSLSYEKVSDSDEKFVRKLISLKKKGVEIEVVADNVFKTLSDTVTPQGIICIVKQPEYSLSDFLQQKNPLFVLLEDLQDPGNLGTIMRTAEGAGVSAVIMNKGTVDIFNPKVVRSTMGAIFRMPFIYVDDLIETVDILQENNVNVYAAHLKDSTDYVNLSYIEGTAFLVGNEGNGLSEEISEKADRYIKIPMQGQLESLNASVSAALLMYEAYRQRRI